MGANFHLPWALTLIQNSKCLGLFQSHYFSLFIVNSFNFWNQHLPLWAPLHKNNDIPGYWGYLAENVQSTKYNNQQCTLTLAIQSYSFEYGSSVRFLDEDIRVFRKLTFGTLTGWQPGSGSNLLYFTDCQPKKKKTGSNK